MKNVKILAMIGMVTLSITHSVYTSMDSKSLSSSDGSMTREAIKQAASNIVFNTTGHVIVIVEHNKLGHDFYGFDTVQPLMDAHKAPVGAMAQVDASALPDSIVFKKGLTTKLYAYVVKDAKGATKFIDDVMHNEKLPSQCGIEPAELKCPSMTDINDYQLTIVTDPKGKKRLQWIRLDSIKLIPTGSGDHQNGFKDQADSVEKQDDAKEKAQDAVTSTTAVAA